MLCLLLSTTRERSALKIGKNWKKLEKIGNIPEFWKYDVSLV